CTADGEDEIPVRPDPTGMWERSTKLRAWPLAVGLGWLKVSLRAQPGSFRVRAFFRALGIGSFLGKISALSSVSLRGKISAFSAVSLRGKMSSSSVSGSESVSSAVRSVRKPRIYSQAALPDVFPALETRLHDHKRLLT